MAVDINREITRQRIGNILGTPTTLSELDPAYRSQLLAERGYLSNL